VCQLCVSCVSVVSVGEEDALIADHERCVCVRVSVCLCLCLCRAANPKTRQLPCSYQAATMQLPPNTTDHTPQTTQTTGVDHLWVEQRIPLTLDPNPKTLNPKVSSISGSSSESESDGEAAHQHTQRGGGLAKTLQQVRQLSGFF
jgi:hypothetical protein